MNKIKKQTKKIIILLSVFSSFQLHAMHKEIIPACTKTKQSSYADDSPFKQLPKLVRRAILMQNPFVYPWENIVHRRKLKSVCKDWNKIISNTGEIAQTLHIPKMHYTDMKNDIEEILWLKLEGYSVLEPDRHGLNPLRYSMSYNRPKV
jgi:hypothetical protein